MGVVYAVHDTQRDQTVAAKTLRELDVAEAYRLKTEFRTLADLRHPNLVRFHELFAGEAHCFFTMELVQGVNFLDHALGRGDALTTWSLERVRDATRQLGLGLAFLHAQGKVHRDIKPTNVIVERTGRTVLLDFGLASDLHSAQSARSRRGVIVGTIAYMSPEQAQGGQLSSAADLYSTGVMLFEALTGTLPFPGHDLRSLLERDREPVPRPRDRVADVPTDLDELTTALLDPRPECRPSASDLVKICTPDGQSVASPVRRLREPAGFIGRGDELRELARALDDTRDGPILIELTGPSGIGKTTLVERFLADLELDSSIALRSRCHPRETVPFKALDGIVDGLARVIASDRHAPLRGAAPRHVSPLLRTFPVMGRISALSSISSAPMPEDPQEVRRLAFDSLRQVLARVGDSKPVVLWIDDAQWSDADSADAFRQMFRPPDPPRALIVVSHRTDEHAKEGEGAGQLLEAFESLAIQTTRIELPPLPDDQVGLLAENQIGSAVQPPDLAAVVREAHGNPLLAIELVRALTGDEIGPPPIGSPSLLSWLITSRLDRLASEDRRVLELLAVAGHPVEESVVAAALGRPVDSLWDLAEQRLLRVLPDEKALAIAPYHDAVSQAVLAGIDDGRRPSLHETLAQAFERVPGRYDDSLVHHWLAAGLSARAADAALDLAEGADAAGAFRRAASFYREALSLGSVRLPTWLLLTKLADAEVNAGMSTDAAPTMMQAAQELASASPGDLQHVSLRRRAASAYLRSGMYRKGREALSDACEHLGVGFPASRARCLWWIVSGRARLRIDGWLRRARAARPIAPADREQIELAWAAGQGLSFLDPARAAAFQARHAWMSQRVQDPRHRARSLATDAMALAFRYGPARWGRTDAMLLEAERLAAETGDPLVISLATLMRACALALNFRWPEALEVAERGERFCATECRGARWELGTFQQTILMSLGMTGEYRTLQERMSECLREADDRGDEFAKSMIPIGVQNLAWLALDDPDEAERQIERAVGPEFEERSLWYLYHAEYARAHIELYRGRGRAAKQRQEKMYGRLEAGLFLRAPTIRVNLRYLHGRAVLLAAEREADGAREREQLIDSALADARKIRAERANWTEPFAERIFGLAAAARGDRQRAREQLERAAIGFQYWHFFAIAAGTRMQIAGLHDGAEGESRAREAAQWLNDHGVRDPARFSPLC